MKEKKLWSKGYTTHNIVDKFTVGNDRILDLKLAKYDVQGSRAHAQMLESVGLISKEDLNQILEGLAAIENDIETGEFVIEDNFEDVHSKVEFELTEKIGEAGKKIHTARSRNDQVLVDLHLYIKAEIEIIKELIAQNFKQLLELADRHQDQLMPGYTHMQIAMPSSFGLWFSAYAESLTDDVILLNAAFKVADQNPLGSAAGQGSSFPINRQMTTDLLGFETMKYNVVAAQMSRGKLEKTLSFALASVAGTMSKLASDVCLYMGQNFNFINFPKELTTGSSIMPHKNNPDVFELIRAKSNKIQQLPAEITLITNNLPSGYHRDFQLLKESLMDAIDTIKDNLEVLHFMMGHIQVRDNILEDDIYNYIFSVEAVNDLVQKGMSFRDAYKKIGQDILQDNFQANKNLNHTHEGSIGNLFLEEIRHKFQREY